MSDAEKTPQDLLETGYSEPLFRDAKPKWTDERLVGGSVEKTSVRYHDKNNVLKITNGLCADIFFRAEDVQREDFKDIPDCADPVEGRPRPAGPIDYRKPLDSRSKKRTYTLAPTAPEPKRGSHDSRRRSRPPRRRRR